MTPLRTLYVSSGGISEPLIRSQVLAYLRGMRPALASCRLVTIERTALSPEERVATESELADAGLDWTPIEPTGRDLLPRPLRTVRDGRRTVRELYENEHYDLIHARSFLPGQIARSLRRRGVPLLYDMRGLWVREKIDKGSLRPGFVARRLQAAEDRLFHDSDRLISLTHTGVKWLHLQGVRTPVDVIPCCVDTEHFRPADGPRSDGPLRLISIGSLGRGYLPTAVFGVFRAALRADPDSTLHLVTRTDREVIDAAARRAGVEPDVFARLIRVESLHPRQVPAAIRAADVGLCMIDPTPAKVASSPTKLAEYLACGLPVIASAGCGDVDAILADRRLGAIVATDDRSTDGAAIEHACSLARAADTRAHCRQAAIDAFSLEVGVGRYLDAYSKVLGRAK